MPRAIVGPGSESKRSASIASSWRVMNLRCCATSVSASPCACRASASALPTPSAASSVIFASLKGLIFRRAGEAAAQLVGIAGFGDALARLAFDAQGEPERLCVRAHQLVVARYELARLVHPALAVADVPHLYKRRRIVGVELQRALAELFGVLDIVGAQDRKSTR